MNIRIARFRPQPLNRAVGRYIIDDYHLDILVRLRKDRIQTLADPLAAVECRDDDADTR